MLTLVAAAIFTVIQPAPVGETDLVTFVEANYPTYQRVSDDADRDFSRADGSWLVGFENLVDFASDWDFNDLVVELEFDAGLLLAWSVVLSDSAAVDVFGFNGVHLFDFASAHPNVITASSDPSANVDGLDHMVSWRLPQAQAEVPEASTWVLLALGLAGVWVWSLWRAAR